MKNTSSVAEEQMPKAGELDPSAASAVLPSQPPTSTSNPIEVFPNAQHFSVSGGTFNISLSSATYSQAIHEPGQSQYKPSAPDRTFTAPVPTLNVPAATDSEIYARLLLPKRHGYPLWIPEPYEGEPSEGSNSAHPAKGVRVGDVGVVNDDGGFQYLFNVCHSSDSPLNCTGVPDGFAPFPLKSLEVHRQISRFPVDSYIASTQIERAENNQQMNCVSETSVLSSSTFTSSISEGAIIVLPKGAHRFDARNLAGLRQYAMRNAMEWYKYVNGRRGWEVPNDALYFVTGCDKCTCWAMTSFCEHTAEGNALSLELLTVTERENKHDIDNADERLSSVRYIWKGGSIMASRAGPGSDVPQSGYGSSIPARRHNHCIFLRGYKIAINADESGRVGAEDKVVLSSVVDSSPDIIFSKGTHIPFGLDSGMFSGLDAASNSNPTTLTVERRDAESGEYQDTITEPHITFSMQHVPGRQQPYHPSDVVNRFLLSQNEHVKVAVTHDDEWCSALDPAAVNMPEDDELLHRVLSTHSVTTSPDGAFLEPMTHPDTENSSVAVPVNSSKPSETHTGLSLLSPSPSFLRESKKATSHIPDTECSSHIPNLVFKPEGWIDMGQNSVLHSGELKLVLSSLENLQLRMEPECNFEGHSWVKLYVFLYSHCLVLAEPYEWNGIMEYHVICRPIPLDLLTLGSFTTLANHLSISMSDDIQSSFAQFPCQLIYNGRPGRVFDLFADTAQVQLKWKQKLEEAFATHKVTQANRLFKLEVLSENVFRMPAPYTRHTYLGDTPRVLPSGEVTGKVTCSVSFTTTDGRTMVAVGCDKGIWIGTGFKPMRHALHLKSVTQCAVLEDFGVFLVLADKSLLAYHIESFLPLLLYTPSFGEIQAQKLNNGKNVEFFRVGTLQGRTLLIYMEKEGFYSIFSILEPVKEKINEKVKAPSAFSFKLPRPAKSEWFRHYRHFPLPVHTFDVIFLKAKLAILCTNGFEIIDLSDFQSLTLPRQEDPRLARFAKRCEFSLPLGMFQLADNGFLLCYDKAGFYVNGYGNLSRDAPFEWEGTAERVALHFPYILLFDQSFIEIRHLETGRLEQIIPAPARNLRCVWDGRGVVPSMSASDYHDWDESMNQNSQIHIVMTAEIGETVVQEILLPKFSPRAPTYTVRQQI